jgi:hypothetical protein
MKLEEYISVPRLRLGPSNIPNRLGFILLQKQGQLPKHCAFSQKMGQRKMFKYVCQFNNTPLSQNFRLKILSLHHLKNTN